MEVSRFFTPKHKSTGLAQDFDEFGISIFLLVNLIADKWLETAAELEPFTSYTGLTSTSAANTLRDQQAMSDADNAPTVPFDSLDRVPRMFGELPTLPFGRPTDTRQHHSDQEPVFSPGHPSTPTPMQPRKRPRFTPLNKDPQAIGFGPISQKALQPAISRIEIPTSNSVPAPKVINGITLLSPLTALPDRLQSLFRFPYFNAMQSKAFPPIYETDKNIVLSAPTASGKTTCFDIAIARLMRVEGTGTSGSFKVRPTEIPRSLPGRVYRSY
jgi:hypothetical protein